MQYRATLLLSVLFFIPFASGTVVAAGTMRAGVIENGAVVIRALPVPEPQAGQVRVRVHAVSVNPVDWKIAARAGASGTTIAGRDLAGVIDALGPDTAPWQIGDAVIGIGAQGSYAEYAIASVTSLARKPDTMSFAEAAGIPVVGDTAWRAIVTVGEVQAGQRILIHGAAGGVGSSAVQIAAARGAYIIATASPRNHEFLRTLGAAEVIDYNTTRFEEVVSDLDMVLNTVDADTGRRSIGVLKPGGVLVSIVGPTAAAPCAVARIRCAETGRANGAMLPHVVELANARKFRIPVERELPIEEANSAWEMNRTGHTRGKIVLSVIP